MPDKIAWTEFNRNENGGVMRHSEPKTMTRDDVIAAVTEWYDAIGTGLNDFDGIQFIRVKEAK